MPDQPDFGAINIHSNVAVYLQIENQVQFAIASGKLNSGDQLPAVAKMAQRVGVNINTVAKAYRDLEVMGLVYTRRGMGVFINRDVTEKCRKDCLKRLIARVYEIAGEAKAAAVSARDVKAMVDETYAAGGEPYSEPPACVMALARPKAKPKKRGK
ncbi:MAG: GntR family transcriptional regulator [Nitrospiraceae bacterium]|nr:GntR family transcriptional regulator [Nitrospiraceae bacterium]